MSLNHRYYTTLPRWGRRLNRRFIAAFGKPAGLWLPNDVVNKAYDFSSNRNIGTLNGVVPTASGWGTLQQAWQGNGTSAYIAVNDSPALQLSTQLTLACVFASTATSGDLGIARKDTQSGTRYLWGLNLVSGAVNAQYYNGTVFSSNASGYNDGKSHLAVLTISGTKLTNNMDGGKFIGTATISGTQGAPTGQMAILADPPLTVGGSPSNFLPGSVSFTAVWNYALTAGQLATLYSCLRYGEPFPLFGPEIIKRRYSTRQLVGSVFKFRRTLSQFGTRIGSRQIVG